MRKYTNSFTGQFDTGPPAKFTYTPSYPAPRKYIYADKIAHDYYSQYVAWQKQTNDPALRNSNYWADNWEELGKYL